MTTNETDRERLRSIFETILEAANAARLALTVNIEDGTDIRFIYVNAAAAELIGEKVEDIIGQRSLFRVAPEDLPRLKKIRDARLAGALEPHVTEMTILRRDGRRVAIEAGVSYVPFQGTTAAVTIFSDVSERKRALAALKQSEERFRRLIESAPDAIGVARGGRWIYVNRAFVALMGAAGPDAIVGRNVGDFHHVDEAERVQRGVLDFERQQDGSVIRREYRIVRSDGEVRQVDIASIIIDFEGAPAVLGFARDVTEHNRARLHLIEADRLAAMGTLAAGIGHEINNPLAYVLLNLQMLEREIPSLAAADRVASAMSALRDAVSGVERVRTIVRDLKAFSRLDPDTRAAVDVRDVLASALNMAAHEIRHRARLVTELDDVPKVLANEARLGQVFLNLLMNAVQAMPDHAERGSGANEIRVRVKQGAGDRVIIEFSDTGTGIPPQVLPHIFEPFFTTKPVGVGTGLGLSICQTIVTNLGGEITVRNGAERGTTFTISLPARTDASDPKVRTTSLPPPSPRRMRVLVVEDEPSLAAVIDRSIADRHDVTIVPDGRAALDVLTRDTSFDAILCDLMMPGMNGVELCEMLRERTPALIDRFIFMTGGASTPRVAAFLTELGSPVLEKPFAMSELHRALETRFTRTR